MVPTVPTVPVMPTNLLLYLLLAKKTVHNGLIVASMYHIAKVNENKNGLTAILPEAFIYNTTIATKDIGSWKMKNSMTVNDMMTANRI